MLSIHIPGFADLQLKHLVLDLNGTLAVDGTLLNGIDCQLKLLAEHLTIHVVTADTFGSAARQFAGLPCRLGVIAHTNQDLEKLNYLHALDAKSVVAIGNGRNDWLMLKEAALGIGVIQREGAASQALQTADVVINDIHAAFELLLKPQRLVATLRN
jgi:soluble P-type ATPase